MDILTLSELQFRFLQMGMRICFYRIIIKINFTYIYLTIKITSQRLIFFPSCLKSWTLKHLQLFSQFRLWNHCILMAQRSTIQCYGSLFLFLWLFILPFDQMLIELSLVQMWICGLVIICMMALTQYLEIQRQQIFPDSVTSEMFFNFSLDIKICIYEMGLKI